MHSYPKSNSRLLFTLLVTVVLAGCDTTGDQPAWPQLEGTSWQLVEIQDLANSIFLPSDPGNYTLRFRSGGRLQMEVDCNAAGATWVQEASTLTLTQFITTRALCPPPSLFNRFIMNMENVQSFEVRGDNLFLSTNTEGVRLEFEPLIFVPPGR